MYPPLIHRGGSLDEGTENYKAEHICDKAQIKKKCLLITFALVIYK